MSGASSGLTSTMEAVDFVYRIPFTVLELPHLKLRKPSFVKVSPFLKRFRRKFGI